MIPSLDINGAPAAPAPGGGLSAVVPTIPTAPVKIGRILDEDGGYFGFEYDDTRGRKNRMRLDALTYEGAIREARSYLGIEANDCDADGDRWAVE